MKRTQLLVLSVLALGLQGVAQASPFPADAEASYNLPALSTHADRYAGTSESSVQVPFQADAEASYNLPARDSYAERHARNGGSERAQSSQPMQGAFVAIAD